MLKDGKLDEKTFPNIASLAGDSAWFTNATTNNAGTIIAIPTILTGSLKPSTKMPSGIESRIDKSGRC